MMLTGIGVLSVVLVLVAWGIICLITGIKETKEFYETLRLNREEAKKSFKRMKMIRRIEQRRNHKVFVNKSKNWRI